MFLAGDIGGTKTILAVYKTKGKIREPFAEKIFPSGKYPSLEAIVRDFLGELGINATRATFGVAGPVIKGKASITNLPWVIDEEHLQVSLGLEKVHLINDLQAVAYGVLNLRDDETLTIQEGAPVKGGSIAVIAPGTGLGEAYLTYDGSKYHAYASEGGHVDFAPTSAVELGLLRFLQERYGHVSYERICSGLGLPNVYTYLKNVGYAGEPPWLAKAINEISDPTPVIIEAANTDDLSRMAMNIFVSVLGAEAGNLALKILSTGGIYIGGGIPPRILSFLQDGLFLQAFLKKGRFEDILVKIPVKVILEPKVALIGAASHVFQ